MAKHDWILKFLKTRVQVAVRFLEFEVLRRCLSCATDTRHKKAEDQAGNHHYFCQNCGNHN